MTPLPVPKTIKIYHITHWKNLKEILASGCLLPHRTIVENGVGYINIAHSNIRYKRECTTVPIESAGFLNQYVPFYFAPRSPMLYTINKGNVEGYKEGQASVIYLISSTEKAERANLKFVFTDGHPIMALTNFYTSTRDLNKVDWSVMKSRMWNDTVGQPDRKRQRQAEFLVEDSFPWQLITNIVVYSKKIESSVKSLLAEQEHKPRISIDRPLYFS